MSAEQVLYVDSSAIVKLAQREPQSAALRRYIRRRSMASSALARVELLRALAEHGDAGVARAEAVLDRVELLRVNDRVLRVAGRLAPGHLRSLDAIHLATAATLEDDLAAVCTYDGRMADAAKTLGMRVVAPR